MGKFILIVGFIFCLSSIASAQPKVGDQCPDIVLPDADGAITKLSSLKGKVVLIDFWASWCGPCRVSNKSLSTLYKNYNTKGFEIFGVSLDDNKYMWQKAIQQDHVSWPQVVDTRAANGNQLTQMWNLYYIPFTCLLDREGKVLALNPEKRELEKLLKKFL